MSKKKFITSDQSQATETHQPGSTTAGNSGPGERGRTSQAPHNPKPLRIPADKYME